VIATAITLPLVVAYGCARPAASPVPAEPACAPHTFPIAGACLDDVEARAYCGSGAEPEGGGCLPEVCEDGAPRDLATGNCVPVLALRKLGAGKHGVAKADASVSCDDAGLVVDDESVGCLTRAATCGRGSSWEDGACRADRACSPGFVREAFVPAAADVVSIRDGGRLPDATVPARAPAACVPVVRRDHGETILDVGTWIRLVIGPDGGPGTPAICGPLAQRPWLAGVGPGSHAVVEVRVDLLFPDNNVSEARVTATARLGSDPPGADPVAPFLLSKYLDPLWKTLHVLGGTASASSATVRVRCAVDGGLRPKGVATDAPKAKPDASSSETPEAVP
jgi:hypothetical protein